MAQTTKKTIFLKRSDTHSGTPFAILMVESFNFFFNLLAPNNRRWEFAKKTLKIGQKGLVVSPPPPARVSSLRRRPFTQKCWSSSNFLALVTSYSMDYNSSVTFFETPFARGPRPKNFCCPI